MVTLDGDSFMFPTKTRNRVDLHRYFSVDALSSALFSRNFDYIDFAMSNIDVNIDFAIGKPNMF
jgi:hypothetical protein